MLPKTGMVVLNCSAFIMIIHRGTHTDMQRHAAHRNMDRQIDRQITGDHGVISEPT